MLVTSTYIPLVCNNRMDFDAFKCRACLSESEQMHDLFEVFESEMSLATIIERFLNVELNANEGLSKNICLECAQVVIQFYNFSVTFGENNAQVASTTNKDVNLEIKVEKEPIQISSDRHDDELFCDEEIIIYASQGDDDDNRKVSQIPKYICEVCGYVSCKKSYLTDHMDVHANEPNYSCEFCPKIFRRRATLSRHRRLHIKPKQFICEKCGQKFNDRGTLKTHNSLVHLRTKNFKCLICQQAFSLKSTLEKHVKRHEHKEGAAKQFSCTQCHTKYYDKSSLHRHYSIKHPNVND